MVEVTSTLAANLRHSQSPGAEKGIPNMMAPTANASRSSQGITLQGSSGGKIPLTFPVISSTLGHEGGVALSRLALYLLGPPRIERDGVVVKLDRRKPIALLACIAV